MVLKILVFLLLAFVVLLLVAYFGRYSRFRTLRRLWLFFALPFVYRTIYRKVRREACRKNYNGTAGSRSGERGKPEAGSGTTDIFQGLSKDAAKRKYHTLMKEYHPDNGGTTEKAEELNRAYKEHQSRIK